jgi:hypothetical protein
MALHVAELKYRYDFFPTWVMLSLSESGILPKRITPFFTKCD